MVVQYDVWRWPPEGGVVLGVPRPRRYEWRIFFLNLSVCNFILGVRII